MVPDYIEKLEKTSRWMRELKQFGPFILLAALVLIPDKASSVVWFSIGIVSLILILTHYARKLLFPYLDMSTLFKIIYQGDVNRDGKQESAIAAALVILGVLGLYGIMIWAVISLLH